MNNNRIGEQPDDSTEAYAPFDIFQSDEYETGETEYVSRPAKAYVPQKPLPEKKRANAKKIWLWSLVSLFAAIAALFTGTWFFYKSHALPGTMLWGNNVSGKSSEEIVRLLSDQFNNKTVIVSYNGRVANVKAVDVGMKIDTQQIANEVMEAKRDSSLWSRYNPFANVNIEPDLGKADEHNAASVAASLGAENQAPADAGIVLNNDKTGFDVVESRNGTQVDLTAAASALTESITSLKDDKATPVEIKLDSAEPTITTQMANEAKEKLEQTLENGVKIVIDGHEIARFDASAAASAVSLSAKQNAGLGESQSQNGYLVFDSAKLQQYYLTNIKPNFKTEASEREVITTTGGTEIVVIRPGNDAVKITEGSDANVGTSASQTFAIGGGDVTVKGEFSARPVKATEKRVTVDLSDRKLRAYENGQEVRSLNIVAGMNNNNSTGVCEGELCTPLGDFNIWRKLDSQDMSGSITLSGGRTESWDAKNVGFVNYFSKSGCAIHRIATQSAINDGSLPGVSNSSHGCIGLGWDVAQWFYDWCPSGTAVHIQE